MAELVQHGNEAIVDVADIRIAKIGGRCGFEPHGLMRYCFMVGRQARVGVGGAVRRAVGDGDIGGSGVIFRRVTGEWRECHVGNLTPFVQRGLDKVRLVYRHRRVAGGIGRAVLDLPREGADLIGQVRGSPTAGNAFV